MATVCTHCGTEIPRDNVRFCNHCGAPIPDHSLHSDARMAAGENAPDKINDALDSSSSSSLPEQVARQPFAPSSRPAEAANAKKVDNSNVTPWLGIQGYDAPAPPPRPESRVTTREEQPSAGPSSGAGENASAPRSSRPAPARPTDSGAAGGNVSARRPGQGARFGRSRGTSDQPAAGFAWPEPMTHVIAGRENAADPQAEPQDAFPVLPSTPPPARKLHTKVWDNIEETPTVTEVPAPAPSESSSNTPAAAQARSQSRKTEIEDLPTSSLSRAGLEEEDPIETTLTHLPTVSLSSVSSPVLPETRPQRQGDAPPSSKTVADEHIDQMPTAQWQVPNLAKGQTPSSSGRGNSLPGLASSAPQEQRPAAAASVQPPVAAPTAAPVQLERPEAAPSFALVRSESVKKAKSRLPLIAIVAVVLVCLLALGGWFFSSHSSSSVQATRPVQSVTNDPLGVSLEYPTGWKSSLVGTTLKLADSSNTAQITIARAASGSSNVATYLQQQATNLGMTNAKPGGTVTFAGTSWQQIRGDFQVSGASYTGTIYAGMHNNQLYTWTQMVPKNVAQDEEDLVFSPARSSLRFH
ncbi:zinc ribbon domain-containing protein [Dictyobacter aurantiacus]|uniref:Zinc-ribbon domain-containing protein n=1 Tax=Dictyobacter aurantiacus TaxID=1936993 RepID=A0A401ZIC6_9CHLR|nr:zinc ribbon domain-containing protein [Dictyobacter aurantiacus]GCE06602.1 hypothetical protein KDAU_39310 [Dictyobacter aurantiacus]